METNIQTVKLSAPVAEAIDRINALHAQAETLAHSAKEVASKAIAIAIECGRLLREQKKFCEQGMWVKWLQTNCAFGKTTAYNYMRLYRKASEGAMLETAQVEGDFHHGGNLENPKTLRQAYIATGILPETPKHAVESDYNHTPLVVHARHIDAVVLWYRKSVERNPAKNWKWMERESLINDLTPLVDIYNELVDLQEGCSKKGESAVA